MKKFVSLFLAAVMLCSLITLEAVPVFAGTGAGGGTYLRWMPWPHPSAGPDLPTSGTCGDNLEWSISEDRSVLTFTGNGAMKDYGYYSNCVPWWDYRNTVTALKFPKGITHISNYAFCYFGRLEKVWIPTDNVSLGYESFFGCANLKYVAIGTADGKLTDTITIGAESFEECKKLTAVYLSRGLKTVDWDAFEQCESLIRVYYGGTEQEYKDNVKVDMGNDNGNHWFVNPQFPYGCFYYRHQIWNNSATEYDNTDYWHGTDTQFEFNIYFGGDPFDLSRSDVTPLPPCENDGIDCWRVFEGKIINKQPINWKNSVTGYYATLPDGTYLSVDAEWQSDGYYHWHLLPNGMPVGKTAHMRQDGVCTVCGSSDTTSVSYFDKDGRYVTSTGPVTRLSGDLRFDSIKEGVNIVVGNVKAHSRLEVSRDTILILADGCVLDCQNCGIHVRPGITLTIVSESLDPELMGKLTTHLLSDDGYNKWAGIGSNQSEGSMHIVICGGNLDVNGGDNGAGIGSSYDCGGNNTVDIYNGIIKAEGGRGAAGIGSGSYGSNCNVNIYGGTVEAGIIGAGYHSSAAVYISEAAKVTATGEINNQKDEPVGNTFGPPKEKHGTRIDPSENPRLADGDYIIYTATDPAYCLDIDGSNGAMNSGDNLHLWRAKGAAYNIFTITWDPKTEAYIIKAKHSGHMLDVAGASTADGANIQQWEDNGTDAQRWVFEPLSNGYYYIRCKGGQYMDAAGCVNGILPKNDTNVQSWSFTGATNQMFRPVRLPDSNNSGSMLSRTGIWIIVSVAVLAAAGIAILVIVRKKRKLAPAEGAEEKE